VRRTVHGRARRHYRERRTAVDAPRCAAESGTHPLAAHELFSERGIDVPKVEFARRAGVGQGTLYRRCRHRRDLLATLIERRIREVTGWADAFCRDEDAGRARVETMARIIAARQTDRLLREAIEQPGVRNERLVALRGALLEPVGYLPGPARAAGQIRRDLAPQDIPHPIAAAAEPAPCAGMDGWSCGALSGDQRRRSGRQRRPATRAHRGRCAGRFIGVAACIHRNGEPVVTANLSTSDRYKWIALSNTTLGMLMATIDSSIVLISLPAIFRGINLNPLVPPTRAICCGCSWATWSWSRSWS